jgi:hypothetical protein
MTQQLKQESTMTKEIANTEIRALSDDEMNEVSGGSFINNFLHDVYKDTALIIHVVEVAQLRAKHPDFGIA